MITTHRARFTHGVVHSFTGSTDEALKLVELGLYIGINGCSLKTAENLETVRAIPTDKLMIETGAWLAILCAILGCVAHGAHNNHTFLSDAPWCDIRATHAGFQHVQTTWPTKKAEKHDDASLVKGRNEPCTLRYVAVRPWKAIRHADCIPLSCSQVLEVVSAVRGQDQHELAACVLENTRRVFFPLEEAF
jgi:TatD DNase family protein